MSAELKISELSFSAIDFESAGASRGATDTPVQVGIATMTPPHKAVPADDQYVSFIAPDSPVTWSAQKVHGISTEDLKGAPSLISLWPEIRSRLSGHPVVAHGAGTERKFLRAFPMHGFGPWVDTLHLSRKLLPGLGDYSLGNVASRLSLAEEISTACPDRTWHDALFDAVASLYILRSLIAGARLGELPFSAIKSL